MLSRLAWVSLSSTQSFTSCSRFLLTSGASWRSRLSIRKPPKSSHQPDSSNKIKTPTQSNPSSINPNKSKPGNFLLLTGFTLVGCTAAFVGCAIWRYEQMYSFRKHMGVYIGLINNQEHQNSQSGIFHWKSAFTRVFGRPPQASDIFYAILAPNILVFLAWRVPRFFPFMTRWFVTHPGNPYSSMILSMFSHQQPFHLLCNMLVLHSITTPLVFAVGMHEFVALYLSGGLMGSYASHLFKMLMRIPGPSLGASGAVYCCLGVTCMLFPRSEWSIVLVDQIIPHTFSASVGLIGLITFDTVGLLLFRWSRLDHAAHLGSLLFGVSYVLYLRKWVKNKCSNFMTKYEQVRNRPSADK